LDAGYSASVVERVLGQRQFIVVSNREPYIHRLDDEEIICERPVSGMVTALEPVMRVCGGSWVAHGSGTADREVVDEHDRIGVPPQQPQYHLRRVWLSKTDEDFAGAARELDQALQINPYATDETAAVLHQALCMSEAERRARMAAARETVERNNIYRWAGKIVSELGRMATRARLEAAA
jgi:trehalose-6-phosphate synthase